MAPMVAVPSKFAVQVSVDGVPIKDAWYATLRIVNSGTKDISKSEWHAPFRFRFGGGVTILSAKVSGLTPPGSPPNASIVESSVEIEPVLMNKRDLIEVQVVASGPMKAPSSESRITGVQKLSHRRYIYPPGTGADGAGPLWWRTMVKRHALWLPEQRI
jgi:hypothetical protein